MTGSRCHLPDDASASDGSASYNEACMNTVRKMVKVYEMSSSATGQCLGACYVHVHPHVSLPVVTGFSS